MTFSVNSFIITNGARFINDQLIVSILIITQCDDIPYSGKFLQYDNVDLPLDPSIAPSDLVNQLPAILQNWVNQNYPNI
jgi:hypothetical protein